MKIQDDPKEPQFFSIESKVKLGGTFRSPCIFTTSFGEGDMISGDQSYDFRLLLKGMVWILMEKKFQRHSNKYNFCESMHLLFLIEEKGSKLL